MQARLTAERGRVWIVSNGGEKPSNQICSLGTWGQGEGCELEVYIREALPWKSGRKKNGREGRRKATWRVGRWRALNENHLKQLLAFGTEGTGKRYCDPGVHSALKP